MHTKPTFRRNAFIFKKDWNLKNTFGKLFPSSEIAITEKIIIVGHFFLILTDKEFFFFSFFSISAKMYVLDGLSIYFMILCTQNYEKCSFVEKSSQIAAISCTVSIIIQLI